MFDDAAIEKLVKRAESGDAEAQNELGYSYADGIIDGQPNHNKAIEWFTKSAAQNNSYAQHYLAQYYLFRDYVVEKCLSTAIELWEKSAKQGNPLAQNDLGICYLKGEGVDKDPIRGAELLKKAAEQDCEEAQRGLVYLYRTGDGVEKNLEEVKKWEQRIEDKGYLYTIALFDILGISDNIKKNGTKKVLDLYRQTIELINKVAKDRSVGSAPVPAHGPIPAGLKVRWDQCVWVAGFVPNIGISYFSDTFVIWLRHEKNKEYGQSWTRSAYIGGKYPLLFSDVGVELRKFLHSEYFIFLKLCLEFFYRGIQKGIPLRGCVATGNAYMNKNESMFLGEALVEAARGESAQNSIGFAFGPSFSPETGVKTM